MKNKLIYILTIFLGIFFALVSSIVVLGYERTFSGIKQITGAIILPKSQHTSFVLGDNDFRQVENSTNSETAGLFSNLNKDYQNVIYPLTVPTSGIAGHKNFLYLPPMHGGIDIWTNKQGRGLSSSSSKGYPVYSACSGIVTRVYHPNEEIEIKCDKLDETFKNIVPSLNIKILYAHMGDAVTHESYHHLRQGQRLKQGELIGYQGNVSSITPVNRVTHLHFGVYDLSRGSPKYLDPGLYMGVPTNLVGQVFTGGGE